MKVPQLCAFLSAYLLTGTAAKREIRSYAALGDSYAAGDGAGSVRFLPRLDVTCGRFSEAYPVKVAEYLGLTHWWSPFRNRACGGANTRSVTWHQLQSIRNVDLVTIEVGGNDVDFFPILNECIQQWHPLSSCDRQLSKSRSLIESRKLVGAFDDMIRYAAYLRHEEAILMVLGYARFFNAETEQCNNVTFSLTNPANILSNELRHEFNQLVTMLNDVIRASAEAHGAMYVDVDQVFQGHRFCEDGVTEPRPDSTETWFFRKAPGSTRDSHYELTSLDVQAYEVPSKTATCHPLRKYADLTRAFHPTIEGHKAIAGEVMRINEGA